MAAARQKVCDEGPLVAPDDRSCGPLGFGAIADSRAGNEDPGESDHARDGRSMLSGVKALGALAVLTIAAACGPSEEAAAPEIRPVRVVTVEEREGGETVSLTGTVQAENEVNLAFRIGGRLIERLVNVGDRVEAGQVVARLDPEDDENALRAARAELAAAQGQLVEAQNNYERQQTLLRDGWTTRVRYDEARQTLETIQSRVDAAQAQLNIAKNRLSWAELHADTAGTITARGAESGEVVQAGQMVYRMAREDCRDAVFDVPAQVMDRAPPDSEIEVFLTLNRNARAVGRVREVSPQADPITGTFEVKVGLIRPPAEMRLGSTVTGQMELGAEPGIELPASALTRTDGQPAVWVVDDATETVHLRNVELVRHDPARVVVANGLEEGEIVVTAGVQALRPGQQVRLLDNPR
jgi:membrane fusion protein, multidrug efflux system